MTEIASEPQVATSGLAGRMLATADICRGTQRLFAKLGLTSVTELPLPNGRRADIAGLTASGEIWIAEVKSCLDDFRVDSKWPDYLDYCDAFYFAVDPNFPARLLPATTGLIIADKFSAEIITAAPAAALKAPRRKQLTLLMARTAAARLQALLDPAAKLDPDLTAR